MIVVDTNVIAYLLLEGDRTAQAELILNKDPDWVAPYLWRSEFRNVLVLYIRQGHISLADAKLVAEEAQILMQGKEYEVQSTQILDLAGNSLNTSLSDVTNLIPNRCASATNSQLYAEHLEFPATAVAMDIFAS